MCCFEQSVLTLGVLGKSDTEVRQTDGLNFWTVSRTDSRGFLDREPVDPSTRLRRLPYRRDRRFLCRGGEGGGDRFHVRLKALAARELSHLDITTSAFGQINQPPFHGEYARHLHPALLVLVLVFDDFMDSSMLLVTLGRGWNLKQTSYRISLLDDASRIQPSGVLSSSSPVGPGNILRFLAAQVARASRILSR